jgi:hypothetical protein
VEIWIVLGLIRSNVLKLSDEDIDDFSGFKLSAKNGWAIGLFEKFCLRLILS